MPAATKGRPTTRSTPRPSEGPKLSEAARHLVIPDGITTSVFPRVERRLARAHLVFDPWQHGFGMAALGCRESGLYACTIGGVCASIPRQVGKTRTVGQIVIGLCLEFPGMRVVWTSHHGRTNTTTFKTLQGLVKKKGIREHLAPIGPKRDGIRAANGEQEIQFSNGSLIMFGARAQGFGRGFEEIDILVLDEAQILDSKALDDMVPSTNQAKHPHGALIFFTGTPPRPTDPGDAFTWKRSTALAGDARDHMWVEFAAEPDAASDDESQWPVMNPSYPYRTPRESMLRMRENLPDEDSWRREAMGIWDDEDDAAQWAVWTKDQWSDRHDEDAPAEGWLTGPTYLGVEVTPDRTMASVGVAGECAKGDGIDVVMRNPGTDWVVPALVAACTDESKPVERVVIDTYSPAGTLIEPLRTALAAAGSKTEVTEANAAELTRATGDMHDAVIGKRVWHRDRPEINEAVSHAVKRNRGDGGAWLLDRRNGVDITPITAPILARHGQQLGPVEVEAPSVYESRGLIEL